MYPVFKCHTMYPDGAASHASVSNLLPLKMIMGGTDRTPAETKVRSVVFAGFSPETGNSFLLLHQLHVVFMVCLVFLSHQYSIC